MTDLEDFSTAPNDQTFQDWWRERNAAWLLTVPVAEGLAKNFRDARRAGVRRLEFPVGYNKLVGKAIEIVNADDPRDAWAGWETWGMYHLFVTIKPPTVWIN